MSFPCPSRTRRVVAGLSTALVAGSLTGVLAGPASAAPVSPARAASAAAAAGAATAPAARTLGASSVLDRAQLQATAASSGSALRLATRGTAHAAARTAPSSAVLGARLVQGARLNPGDALRSPSGRYSLVLGTDGVLAYQQAPNRLNAAPTSRPLFDDQDAVPGSFLALQGDGNLVLYGPSGQVVYNFDTVGEGRFLQVQDDGNVVLYGANNAVVIDFGFSVNSYLLPGEVLLPGDVLTSLDGSTRLIMQGDGNLVLYAGNRAVFYTGTSGNDGAAAVLQGDGNLVLYSAGSSPRALYNTGTRNVAGSDTELDVLTASFGVFAVSRATGSALAVYGSAWTSDTVLPGQVLFPGDKRTGGPCTFVLQTDGNLVDYCSGAAVFYTGTSGNTYAVMGANGNFAVLRDSGADALDVVFETRTGRYPGSRLVVQGDRNVVVYTPQGRAVYYTRR